MELEEFEAAEGLRRDWDGYKTRGRSPWVDGRGAGGDGEEGVLGLELQQRAEDGGRPRRRRRVN